MEDRWSKERAWAWYSGRPWINGCNFVPSYAGNTTELWQDATFDARAIDRELALAQGVGYNSVRVFLQYIVWEAETTAFLRNFETFLRLAAARGLSVMPVFFDDCAFGQQPEEWKRRDPYLGRQDEPIPGAQFSNWTPSPGHSRVRDRRAWPRLRAYVRDIMGRYGTDERIVAWDLYNEPTNGGMGNENLPLVAEAFKWAREGDVLQPLTGGVWNDNRALNALFLGESDVITFHQYPKPDVGRFKEEGRPVICTEWMIRCLGDQVFGNVIAQALPELKRANVGSYSWGLVNGRTQGQYQWGSKPATPEPKVWFVDLFRDADGTPYDPDEIRALKEMAKGRGGA